jgi:hypothetical protein
VLDDVLMRRRGVTITYGRALQVGGVLLALLLGAVLPYVTMEHYDGRFEVVRTTVRLLGAGGLLNGTDPIFLPSYDSAVRSEMNTAFNVIGVAPGLQQLGSLLAAATCWGLFFDEINKFLWWPLDLSGYLLVAIPLPLFVGLALVRANQVTIDLGPGWVPAVLAGVLILVWSFRARSRIDTYGGV